MAIRFIILTLAMMLSAVRLGAQELEWSVDFASVLDNREGDSSNDQTIAFTRLAPEIGVSLLDGTHAIRGGVAWDQPIGNGWRDYRLNPTLYYSYRGAQWRAHIGMLPRRHMMEQAPKFLWSDSIAYQQPNIRGFLVQYVRENGYVEFLLDWRQLQTETQREAFNAMVNSRYGFGKDNMLYVGEWLQYNHLAKQKNAPEGQGVNDDFMVNPFVGIDLSRQQTALDSLDIRMGALIGMQRCRMDHRWHKPVGFLAQITAEWRRFGLRETLYVGSNQMPLYSRFGAELNMGSPYYQSKAYSRTDVYGHLISNRYVDLTLALNFHVNKDVFAFWQQLSLRVFIDQQSWRNHDKGSRSERISNMY